MTVAPICDAYSLRE